MNVSLVGRLYRRIQKKIFTLKTLRTAVLSLVLFTSILSSVGTAFAQDATYKNYRELFTGNSNFTSSPITPELLNTTSKKQTGLRFRFNYNFEGKKNPTNGAVQSIDWFWDHVSNSEDAFMIRICETDAAGTVNESACKFARAPYSVYPPAGTLANIAGSIGSLINALIPFTNALPGPEVAETVQRKENWSRFNNIYIFKKGYLDTQAPADSTTHAVRSQDVAFSITKLTTINLSTGDEDTDSISYDLNGQTLKAELWYCGGEPSISGNSDPKPWRAYDTDPSAKKFGDRCENDGKGSAYFKIGETTVTIQKTFAAAQAESQTAQDVQLAKPLVYDPDPMPVCSIIMPVQIVGCIARAVYYVIYTPLSWLAGLFGALFDFFIGYSLSDESYRADFIVRGWRLVRDISNIFFILILVYTGFMAVFNASNVSMKKVVPTLIINALIINFSLFATHIIIDISNITARVFYNVMPVCKGECEKDADGNIKNPSRTDSGYWPLSEKIVSSFNPQKIFTSAVLSNNGEGAATDNQDADFNSQTTADRVAQNAKLSNTSNDYAGYFIVVSLIAAGIMFAVAMMFWKVSFFFLGRVIGLYVAMIFSPFAFLTRGNMPLVGNIPGLKWDDWISEVVKYALLAPIFVFFLYIIYAFLNSNFLSVTINDIDTNNFFGTVIKIVIPMLIIYFMIRQGVEFAKTYAGKVGTAVQGFMTKIAGAVGGVAAGTVGLVGSGVIGGAASAINKSSVGVGLRNTMANGDFFSKKIARFGQKVLNKGQKASFDVRDTSLGKTLFKNMEVNTNPEGLDALKVIGVPGLSVESRKGGFEAMVDRRKKDREEEAKLLEEQMSDDQIKEINKKRKKKYDDKIEKIVDESVKSAVGAATFATMKAASDPSNKAAFNPVLSDQYKAAKEQAILNANVQQAIKNTKEPTLIRSTAELNAARRKEFAESIKNGNFLDRVLNNKYAKFATLGVSALASTLTGAPVRLQGDRKAAKAIEEKTKVEKELGEIEETLKKGFKDLIAIDMFRTSTNFTQGLTEEEKKDIIKHGEIKSGAKKGKRMYDILSDDEKSAVDARQKILNKDEEELFMNMSLAREQTKYEMKTLNNEIKQAKKDWHDDAGNDPTLFQKYMEKLKEKAEAEKRDKVYRNYSEYVKKQKDKLKDEEKK